MPGTVAVPYERSSTWARGHQPSPGLWLTGRPPLQVLIREMLLKKLAPVALRKELLRQHYLDQFFGSPAFRAELSAFVVPVDGRLAPHLWLD